MKVAAVQFAPVFRDQGANLKQAARMVVEAAQNGAQLIVLPELCTTGYSFQSREEAEPHAEMVSDWMRAGSPRSMELLGRMAMNLNVAIAWGVLEKPYEGGDELYNSQVLVLPSGRFWVCRKTNFFGNDYLWATPGNQSPPIGEYLGKKIGLLICADVRDKSDSIEEFYEPGDADVVAFSANWGDGGFPAGKWVEFAKDNEVFLVVSNRYGKERNNDFGEGGVCVIEPCGKVHCGGLKWNEPCIVYAEVP